MRFLNASMLRTNQPIKPNVQLLIQPRPLAHAAAPSELLGASHRVRLALEILDVHPKFRHEKAHAVSLPVIWLVFSGFRHKLAEDAHVRRVREYILDAHVREVLPRDLAFVAREGVGDCAQTDRLR